MIISQSPPPFQNVTPVPALEPALNSRLSVPVLQKQQSDICFGRSENDDASTGKKRSSVLISLMMLGSALVALLAVGSSGSGEKLGARDKATRREQLDGEPVSGVNEGSAA